MKQIAKLSLITLLLLTLGGSLKAQSKFKKYLFLGSSQLISGMLDGTVESISYHYETGFKPHFKKANDQFWNPALSWKNKYKNGDCQQGAKFTGSTTMFAWTTDAYHLLRTTKRAIDGATLAYYINDDFIVKRPARKKWKAAAKDFIILTTIRCIGFHLTYSLMFKKQGQY